MTTIHVERFIPHAPARVWRALTDPVQMAVWLMPNDFRPELGAKFSLETTGWGAVHCEVLGLEPERRLQISWKNPPLDTTVTWTLTARGTGTQLVVEHAGFDVADPRQQMALDGMRPGWEGPIAERLEAVVARLA